MNGLEPGRFCSSHDACGIGYVARYRGGPDHAVLQLGLEAVANHNHRGAVGSDGKTGDGAGVMTQIPHAFFARVYSEIYQATLPAPSDLAVGTVFLPLSQPGARSRCRRILEESLKHYGLDLLGWRDVPVDLNVLGSRGRETRPHIQQLFVARGSQPAGEDFEVALYRARRRAERHVRQELGETADAFYVASLSHRTLVYKGLCMADQLGRFFLDLADPEYRTSVCMFHQRYSTNTFPKWHLAHPFRLICHNGEFNTLQGNWNWMRAREAALHGVDDEAAHLTPIIGEGVSDSGAFDNVLEYIVRGGRELLPSLLLMIPEMWENIPPGDMPERWHDFYAYLSCLMEPWDGPAAVAFFDGRFVGTILDRNGLRPVRYTILDGGLVISASEEGCVEVDEEKVVRRGMLGPGEILVVDLEEQRIYDNHEIKTRLSERQPYKQWASERVTAVPREVFYGGSPYRRNGLLAAPAQKDELQRRQLAFGYTSEDEIAVLRPMVTRGLEPVGSMGDDTPPAALSHIRRPLFHYFRQRFAQVTNPAMDPLRERVVMSLRTLLGRRANILTEVAETTNLLECPGPILSRATFEHICSQDPRKFPRIVLRIVWAVSGGALALEEALDSLCHEAEVAVRQGAALVILYDGELNPFRAPIPALLAVSAVHHHLIACGLRLRASLIVASAEPREVHHFACLLGFGADAIYPFLAYETISEMVAAGGKQMEGLSEQEAHFNFIDSVEKGLLKIMAKMGIALLSSYRGAQVFEALGLGSEVIRRYFPHTSSQVGGVGTAELARYIAEWHRLAYGGLPEDQLATLASYGFYKYKKDGELHRYDPGRVRKLHKAVKAGEKLLRARPSASPFEVLADGLPGYEDFARAAESDRPIGIRDLLGFVRHRPAVDVSDVEPLRHIVRRFSTGAMSHGSLSAEAHETLALAMNRLGGMSNCGEGGEDPTRFGTEKNSRIKQVASGRFGVTTAYLMAAEELQIKISQGSKPGEGGQIPGHKISLEIARIRHTTPGVALISPPPHHDVYSIEDLAQLIFDLKRVNPNATISVKLVSCDGVGTVAAGVAKGFADLIHISGCEGGTGASPLSSIKFAGMPWELGLAQTQQVLVRNGLRHLVRLRVDGGFQTGRDVLMAGILGADEFSFGTVALVAEGCLMARTCHTNNCPVGIASQSLALRKKYPGSPEMVMAYLLGVAHEVRHLLAALGFRSLQEVIGKTELLEQVVLGEHAGHLDLSPLLWRPADGIPQKYSGDTNDPPQRGRDLDQLLLNEIRPALEHGISEPIVLGKDDPIQVFNIDRTVGARLAGWLTRSRPSQDLPEGGIQIHLRGRAGQSFGAFCVSGLHLHLEGATNDYTGKGMSGGEIAIRPLPRSVPLRSDQNSIIGNTVLYGATGGRLFAAGRAGQRFAVRNSGASAVVEGVGEHACEYMTGGTVVVLGTIGRNFGAAMTGGCAFLYDVDGEVIQKLNPELIEGLPVIGSGREQELRRLLEAHLAATGSPRAREILANWETNLTRFWLVQPKETAASIEADNEGVEAEGARVIA
ncbi:MAG: glutamate synthase large subunit [Armatimonadetes bacterium]|nr:glutamate synthase large subunit [Armatimonadota bacterium]